MQESTIRGIIERHEGARSDEFVQFSLLCKFWETINVIFCHCLPVVCYSTLPLKGLEQEQMSLGIDGSFQFMAMFPLEELQLQALELQNTWHQGNSQCMLLGTYTKTPLLAIVMNGWSHGDVLQLFIITSSATHIQNMPTLIIRSWHPSRCQSPPPRTPNTHLPADVMPSHFQWDLKMTKGKWPHDRQRDFFDCPYMPAASGGREAYRQVKWQQHYTCDTRANEDWLTLGVTEATGEQFWKVIKPVSV